MGNTIITSATVWDTFTVACFTVGMICWAMLIRVSGKD